MITKFKAQDWRYGAGKITAVEVERESDTSVWIDGRRTNKHSEWHAHFDTWQAAHSFLLDMAQSHLEAARRSLQTAQDRYGNVKGMKAPA